MDILQRSKLEHIIEIIESTSPHALENAISPKKDLGIHTLFDLLLNPPKSYQNKTLLPALTHGAVGALRVEITQSTKAGFGKKSYLRIYAHALDFGQEISMTLFHPKPFMYKSFGEGAQCVVYGKLEQKGAFWHITQPKAISDFGAITMDFKTTPAKNKLLNALSALITHDTLQACGIIEPYASALYEVFHPTGEFVSAFLAHSGYFGVYLQALKFTEILHHILRLRTKNLHFRANFVCNGDYKAFVDSLPFTLTQGQSEAIESIATDLNSSTAARRLIMGDVGCGKTIVILSAVMMAYPHKSILMAPTSILAKQLYEEARRFLPPFVRLKLISAQSKDSISPKRGAQERDTQEATQGISAPRWIESTLFTQEELGDCDENTESQIASGVIESKQSLDSIKGSVCARSGASRDSLSASDSNLSKTNCDENIESSDADFIIGTQAILYRDFDYTQFALVMSDEQHRFGTNQRHKLEKMFSSATDTKPHALQFSATPIPRTFAMMNAHYIKHSIIKDLPFKKDIQTRIVGKSDFATLLAHLRTEFERGHQAIIIYPLVEESEHIDYLSLSQGQEFWFRHFEGVYVTSGKDKQKQEVLAEFASKGNLLLATTVVEVGISLPRLSTIVIVAPERLGLATLHQLRGRVSRNGLKGYCFLYTTAKDTTRLESFAKTLSGFEIAELDLKNRSSGDLLSGIKQSGNEFRFFDPSSDEALIREVNARLLGD
ncbi:DEAD/DEAH box helicase [uncultured Helicobacter sp.]|uniref:DEAD/DEAH box helicase n=1 Tax=uncultured Helicobacter sp. TaxID=175537 RepID=UPI00375280FA